MVHVAASLVAFSVFRTSTVAAVELRGWGGSEPRTDLDGTPAYPTAVQPSVQATVVGQPSEGQPYLWPSMIQPVLGGAPSDSPCEAPVSPTDMEQPIASVKSAYGDGFCHFSSTASWLKECHAARKDKNYFMYAKSKGLLYQQQISIGASAVSPGPPDPMPVLYAGGTRRLVTQLQAWPLEDVYCDAMGWMDVPTSVISNSSMLELMAKSECNKLSVEHPEFALTSMKELVALMNNNNFQLLQSVNRKGPGPCVADMKRHAVSRCLLGGLECDIANCATNFCRRDDLGFDYVGHGNLQCSTVKLSN